MTPRRAWTVAIVFAVALLIWTLLITIALTVFAVTGQPLTLPAP